MGCSPAQPIAPQAPSDGDTAKASATQVQEQTTWDAYFLDSQRIGYGRTTSRRTTESGREVVHINRHEHLAVKRGADRTEQDIRVSATETPDGRLFGFALEMQMSRVPIRTVGKVNGDRLDMEITTQGKTTTASIPWSPDYGGPFAIEQTLANKPMQPGERRSLKCLTPGFQQVADVALTAEAVEPTPLLGGTFELLRIVVVTRFPGGQPLDETLWTDGAGVVLKTRIDSIKMVGYRTTESVALEKTDAANLDLLAGTAVKLDRPLSNAHHTKRARYRVHLERGDPATAFVTGPTQQVKRIDAHTAEVTVYAIRPGKPDGNLDAPADPPTDADRKPNNMIQYDDPAIVAEAKQAAGNETDPWRVAVALEQYVKRVMTKTNYSQAFATAAEVAKSHEGDCTEHAVFLAALARARGIPARVAMGLVYVEPKQKDAAGTFLYHMWTEVFVDGRWIPIDGTLALGGIGAAHLKLAQSNLESLPYSAFLTVAQVVGGLRIEVVNVGDR